MSESAESAELVETAGQPANPSTSVETDLVAQYVAPLSAVSELPVAEHAAVYQQVHAKLQDALAEIDGR